MGDLIQDGSVNYIQSALIIAYMIACIFFIRGIKMLGKADTARKGNFYSSIVMLIAVIAVLFESGMMNWDQGTEIASVMIGYLFVIAGIIVGGIIGAIWSKKVEMTGMPELVALFNGFGGLSSLLVAIAEFANKAHADNGFEAFATFTGGLTIAVGAITFTGSVVAWGKLSGKMFKKQTVIPSKNLINAILVGIGLLAILGYTFFEAIWVKAILMMVITVLFLILGITMVVSIGGGDMPVIISLLNAFSGVAASFAGFAIDNTVLVVAGCLVGASGVILTLIMCKAMNRTLYNLIFGSFGATDSKAKSGEEKEPKALSVEDAFLILEAANSVVFIPGYGMAVAQAQHAVKELAAKLEENGAEVSFAIHPVAGRMPGHMNVLLAEADVPYEQLKTADEMNPTMPMQDVAIVIGANDVVNPAAIEDKSSPIYGMPIINAFEAKTVFVLKRGKGTGFSGLENPLFTNDNTVMIYGDAKQTVSALVSEFGES